MNRLSRIIQTCMELLMLPVFFLGVVLMLFACWFVDNTLKGRDAKELWAKIKEWLDE